MLRTFNIFLQQNLLHPNLDKFILNAQRHLSSQIPNAGLKGLSADEYNVMNTKQEPKNQKLSTAMKVYLNRAKEYDEFLRQEKDEYMIGKRHLANMMGEDPNTFTQDDVNKAIEYLFPSGLYEPHARPIMDEPEKIFPPKKAAQFDISGRPFHSIFFTLKPNYYSVLYDIVEHFEELNKYEDQQLGKGLIPNETHKYKCTGSDWLKLESFEKMFLEPLTEKHYNTLIATGERLVNHPYSAQVSDFLKKFRVTRKSLNKSLVIPPLEYDETGRPYIMVKRCQKFMTTGTVKLLGNGTGKIKINNKDITFFETRQHREQVLFPLIFSGMENSVDVEVTFDNDGGKSGYASLIRWGIAWGLRSFVDNKMIEKMRIAGLLTRDWRRRERKKPGQEGKRRQFTWVKR